MGAGLKAETVPSFGTLLRTYRIRAGFSQETLAERARLSASAISTIERGARRAPYRHTIELLAGALELSIEERNALLACADGARARGIPVASKPAVDLGLPVTFTSFIDRPEVAELAAAISQHRLVTITGSGGVGKTRTAIEAIKRVVGRREDVSFVDLSDVDDGLRIPFEIAAALKLVLAGDEEPMVKIELDLERRTLLLVLDNCEHVIGHVALAARRLLQTAHELTILVTSREPLGLANETIYRLPSLTVPNEPLRSVDDIKRYPSLELMLARVSASESRSPATLGQLDMLADICRELEGIPLAIELAAFHLPFLGPATLRARLHEGLALAGARDLPPRQRTMVATIRWSVDLLDPSERALLQRLSVFSGGFTLEAAEHVCAGAQLPRSAIFSALARLVQKSLVSVRSYHPQSRYVLLESVRTFALSLLTVDGQEESLRRAHLRWIVDVTKTFVSSSPRRSPNDLCDEIENITRAVRYGMASNDLDDILASGIIVGGLRLVWFSLERVGELRALAEGILAHLNDDEHPAIVGPLCVALCNTWNMREPERALVFGKRAIPLLMLVGQQELAVSVSMQLAVELAGRGRFDEAEELIEASSPWLDSAVGNASRNYYNALYNRAQTRKTQSRFELARTDYERLLSSVNGSNDPDSHFRIYATVASAENEFAAGNCALAIAQAEAIIDRFRADANEPRIWMAVANANVAGYHLLSGDREKCRAFATEALRIAKVLGYEPFPEPILYSAGATAQNGQLERAAILLGYVDAAYKRIDYVLPEADARCRNIVSNALSVLSPETRAVREADGASRSFVEIAELVTASR